MGVTNIFGGFNVEFDAVVIGGINAYDLGTGTQLASEISAGNVYPEYPHLMGQQMVGTFSTIQIARALDNCGLTGTSIADLTTGLKYYLRKHADGSTRASGGSHNKYTIKKGIIVPTSLTCEHQGTATITFDVVITYDGSNVPIILAASQSLPAAQSDDQEFTLGPLTLESVLLDHVQQFTITFGLTPSSEGADSDIWDKYASIRTIKPSLSLTGSNPNWLADASIPLTGLRVTHANTAFYLRKYAIGSTFVADGSAQHIKFTAAGLAVIDDVLQVSGEEPSGTTLTMPLHYDGTNAPLTINTASAIT